MLYFHICIFQSTLPRGERQINTLYRLYTNCISIHAPTRGATNYNAQVEIYREISIHAPTRGATSGGVTYTKNFGISIHAPTRGATTNTTLDSDNWNISIHAPTRGATIKSSEKKRLTIFQSTLPRGERQQFSPKSSLFSQQKLSKIFNLNNKLF